MLCDIIIPYYQSRPGVLAQAVMSVVEQSLDDWRLLIIDDGSPHPAAQELSSFSESVLQKVTLIRQENGGVAAARNAGLNAISDSALFVAFLDSDDVWGPDHLRLAVDALRAGAEFYWCGAEADEGFTSGDLPSAFVADAVPTEQMAQSFQVHETGLASVLVGQWWRHMHLSKTVISRRLATLIRFDRSLDTCEDFDFYRRCADYSPTIVTSDKIALRRGKGDNIWHGTAFSDPKVGTERFRMLRQLRLLRRHKTLAASDLEMINKRIERARETFIWHQFERLKQGKSLSVQACLKWMAFDPSVLVTLFKLKFKPGYVGQDPDSPNEAPPSLTDEPPQPEETA